MNRILVLLFALLMSVGVAFGAVNVNTATQAELESLNGIGPVKAKAIIDYRTKNGPFKTVEELDKVPGIGEGTLGKIRNDVTLTGKTTVTADAKKDKAARKTDSKAKEAKVAKEDKQTTKAEAKPVPTESSKDAKEAKASKSASNSGSPDSKSSEMKTSKPEAKRAGASVKGSESAPEEPKTSKAKSSAKEDKMTSAKKDATKKDDKKDAESSK